MLVVRDEAKGTVVDEIKIEPVISCCVDIPEAFIFWEMIEFVEKVDAVNLFMSIFPVLIIFVDTLGNPCVFIWIKFVCKEFVFNSVVYSWSLYIFTLLIELVVKSFCIIVFVDRVVVDMLAVWIVLVVSVWLTVFKALASWLNVEGAITWFTVIVLGSKDVINRLPNTASCEFIEEVVIV